jgi:cystathionine beta-lyase
VLPAWVADMDVRPSARIRDALHAAVSQGRTTYPAPAQHTGVPEAFAAFHGVRHGWEVNPARVILVGDVMGGLELALRILCPPGPIAIPVPNYGPFFDLAAHVGRGVAPVPHVRDGFGRPTLDLDELEAAFRSGARTLLLSHPQNPLGRAFDETELQAWIDVARRFDARIVSDEIWGPLTFAPARYVPLASLPGADECVVTVAGAAKSFNVAGLKSAMVVTTSAQDSLTLRRVPVAANHGQSAFGLVAAEAAFRHGGIWLDSVIEHLRTAREQLERLVATQLPGVTMVRPEATFLAWLDTTQLGIVDPGPLALERGRIALSPGGYFDPGTHPGAAPGHGGHVRLNFGTSPERLERIVAGLARAWYS